MSNADGPLSRLSIDLDAIARNYLYLVKKIKTGADCAAVVKADSYGLGAAEISKELFRQGCRHFFVATPDEAAQLKKALPVADAPGKDLSIYILSGMQGAAASDIAAEVFVPVLNNPEDIELWSARGPCVIHMDTGMNRLGLSARETGGLAENRSMLQKMDIRYVMSHLACADEPAHPKNAEQLQLFKNLTASLGRPFRYSLANSAGIFLGLDYHFDLVRPGAAIYGINVMEEATTSMQAVARFESRILQIREIEGVATVGYGASHAISPPAKTATISVGYADGYFRHFESRGAVYIQGMRCPVIGRISMDYIVADVSALKTPARVGDWAEIIGPHQAVDDVARQAGTIGYEVFTAIGARVKRFYKGTEV
jgi:alanine racemase